MYSHHNIIIMLCMQGDILQQECRYNTEDRRTVTLVSLVHIIIAIDMHACIINCPTVMLVCMAGRKIRDFRHDSVCRRNSISCHMTMNPYIRNEKWTVLYAVIYCLARYFRGFCSFYTNREKFYAQNVLHASDSRLG